MIIRMYSCVLHYFFNCIVGCYVYISIVELFGTAIVELVGAVVIKIVDAAVGVLVGTAVGTNLI